MLTHEENERLTQTGAGTPMGELLRRFLASRRGQLGEKALLEPIH
jgi:hypothetical protein